MQRYRFLADKITDGGYGFVTGQEAVHARKVLRLGVGAKVVLFNGNGNDYFSEIIRYHSKEKFEVKIISMEKSKSELSKDIVLLVSLIKSNGFELVLQKAVEIGIKEIIPINTQYSIIKVEEAVKKIQRWNKIILSGVKQSGRSIIPSIKFIKNVNDLEVDLNLSSTNTLVASLDTNATLLKDGIKKIKNSNPVYIFIGPEGGFSESEVKNFTKNNYNVVTLGNSILRSETAAIFLLSVLAYTFS